MTKAMKISLTCCHVAAEEAQGKAVLTVPDHKVAVVHMDKVDVGRIQVER